jgi:16S rRNA (cytosine1402-N4)-methyltransferase
MPYQHVPVMLSEVIAYLNCRPGKLYIDGTIGGSGHAGAILEKISPDGQLIGIDQDLDAIENAKSVLRRFESNTHFFHGSYIHFPEVLSQLNIPAVDGILLDLGLSLHQIVSSGRGFSFKRDEPLDMRMDTRSGLQADDLVNNLDEKALSRIFKTLGEERRSKQIARRICTVRQQGPIRSSKQLAEIVAGAVPRSTWRPGFHPATRVFMALRIAVNKELERLEHFMNIMPAYLNPGGRICILTFHSLEDRIVKQHFRELEKDCICPPDLPRCACNKKPVIRILIKKGLTPSPEEISANPLARSARLRAAEKLTL